MIAEFPSGQIRKGTVGGMEKVVKLVKPIVDEEWVQLLAEARELGITPEEVRLFLEKNKFHSNVQ